MAETKSINRITNIQVPVGYYRSGKKITNKFHDNHGQTPEKGDVRSYKDRLQTKLLIFDGKKWVHKVYNSKTAWTDKDVPEALKGQVKGSQQTGYYKSYGHGGSSKRWVGTSSSKTITFGSGGFGTPAVTATKDQEAFIKANWNFVDKPNANLFGDNVEALAIARSRWKKKEELRAKYGGNKGIKVRKFKSGTLEEDGHTHFQIVPNKWTPDMNNDDYKPVEVNALTKDKTAIDSFSKLEEADRHRFLFINDPIEAEKLNEVEGGNKYTLKRPILSSGNQSSGSSGIHIDPKNDKSNTSITSGGYTGGAQPGELISSVVSGSSSSTDISENLSSYEQDATTSWGRGGYNTKGTTKDIKSRNQRTMAYWGGKQDSGGKGYDFSGYRGDQGDLAAALRTGRAWETGKGTIIYQPDQGVMQVFKQSTTKPIIEKGPGDNVASIEKVQNNA